MNFIKAVSMGLFLVKLATSTPIKTKNGLIEGTTEYLFNGKQVNAYLGIPYAAPPIGDNRFLSPKPVKDWNGVFQATNLPPSCYQAVTEDLKKNVWFVSDSIESEDCLYLNIWKPVNVRNTSLPVMFWIHGGGFLSGSSNLPLYNGRILAAEENVMVVTINYRLSMLACLYLNSSGVMGNAGLQDQLQALQWVQDNIAAFGGDPSRVTILGESAGGASVDFHLQNPSIHSLFQNGIIQSAPRNLYFTEEKALNASLTLALNVNCSSSLSDDLQDILNCLRKKTPKELLASYLGFNLYFKYAFLPVSNGVEVPRNPTTAAVELPTALRKNVIIGSIPNEMNYFINIFIPGKVFSENTTVSKEEFRGFLQGAFQLEDDSLQDIFIFEFRNFDTINQTEYRVEVSDIYTDLFFLCPSEALATEYCSEENHIYYFYFTHRPSTGDKSPIPKWAGAIHGDEIPFIFGHPLDPEEGYTRTEIQISKNIMRHWASFARTGNPNSRKAIWPEVSADQVTAYLEFNDNPNPVAKYGLKERECQFLNTIYPELLKLQGALKKTA